MKKTLVSIILILALVMSSFAVFADTTPGANDLARDFYASPYKDGVIISWNNSGWSWCEMYMTPEGGTEGQFNRGSYSHNNAIQNNVFIDENASFSNGVTFDNTPGKTYSFRVIGYVGGSWQPVVSTFTYTVPTTPTLSVASDYLANTLTYTLVNNGKGGAIYRYDSEAKAKLGGNDYDKKIDVTYGGDPVTDTVDAAGTYYYTIKQEGISDTPELIIFKYDNKSVNTQPVWDYFTVTEGENNSFTVTGTINQAGIASGSNVNWTIAEVRGLEMATADNAATALKESGESYRFFKSLEGVTDANGAIKIRAGVTFTLDGTTKFDNVTNEESDSATYPTKLQSTKLKRGEMYKIHLVSQVGSVWDNEAFGLIMPEELTVVSATNTEPTPAPESWVKNMEVAGDGIVNINIDMPAGTWWGEVAIFTEEQNVDDLYDIYNYILNRGARNAVISGNWNGTIGPDNVDYDLPFTFVDGTTYYVYVCLYNGSTWEYNPTGYEFTYEAPAPTEETWITDATVVGDGLVNLTFGNLGDDTSWSEIAIFTEDKGALDFNTIYAGALSRPGNHSVWGGHKEGTVGSNGQFAFELVDGTTYYVYVVRNVGGVWDDDHLIKPFSFTYNAPQATPEPTPVPTPTVIPDDGDNGTADISVVLYAITALAGAGAVVAIKRKKA